MIYIKEATGEDIMKLGELGRAFIERSISSKFLSYDEETFIGMLVAMVEAGIAVIWTAKDNESIVGAICLAVSPNIYNPNEIMAEILFIDVLPEYQRKGVAGKLLDIAEAHAEKCGITAISVCFKSEAIAKRIIEKREYSMFEWKLMKKVRQ